MLLHIDLNIQDDEAEKAVVEEQKKVSPSCYYNIILGTCCSNKLKMLLHIDLNIQDSTSNKKGRKTSVPGNETVEVSPSCYNIVLLATLLF
jgi:hypothetical protein